MRITFLSIAPRKADAAVERLVLGYLARFGFGVQVEAERFRSERDYLTALGRDARRQAALLVALDGRGQQLSSEQLASWIGEQRGAGRHDVCFAVGPASGWSDEVRRRAAMLLSLGPMTLPHELARLVLVEQVYRAFTILSGHPYHSGH